jgi:hypothetical protein
MGFQQQPQGQPPQGEPQAPPAAGPQPPGQAQQNPQEDLQTWVPRGAWRVLVLNQAQRLEDDLIRLRDGGLGVSDTALIARCVERARNAAMRPSSQFERVLDWWTGARAETAWGALHEAGQLLFEHQSPEAVFVQIPEILASVSSSLREDDPRRASYLKQLAVFEQKAPGEMSPNDRAVIGRIRRTADAASDAAHGNVRSYRNLLLALGVGMSMLLVVMALLHALVPTFISFTEPAGTDAPEIWAIEIAGFFGGSIAAVLALSRLEGFTGPYSLSGYQALLRVPMAGAVGLLGIVLLQSNIFTSLKPVHGLELYAYAIFFGYAQEPLLRMIDKRAATVLESARSKDDPGGSSSKSAG